MDFLVEMPIESWKQLQERLKKLGPVNVPGYSALCHNMKFPDVREAFQFRVYCPEGNMDYGFVAVNEKDNRTADLIIFPTSTDLSKLEEALLNTTIIDWSRKICIDMVPSMIVPVLEKIRRKIWSKSCIYDKGMINTVLFDKAEKPFDDIQYPNNTYVSEIKEKYIQMVDACWSFHNPCSEFYFRTLISNGLSYGLYSSDDKLIAWLLINEYQCLCNFYCVKEQRRKGYGRTLIKHVINDQLRNGNDIYGCIEKENVTSCRLLLNLGFRIVDEGAYYFVKN